MQLENVNAAVECLSAAMREDSAFAWTWHCNLSMIAQDAGASPELANEKAADFMTATFGVDIRQTTVYQDLMDEKSLD